MKIIFFGSSDFAVPILNALKDKEDVILTVTQPDRPKGRSNKMAFTPVKELSRKLNIEIFQPISVNTKDSIERLKGFNADMFIIVSFGQILKKEILEIPRFFCLNVHTSLLPKYRGAAPINWSIANGEKETGVTIIKMNEKMDEGDILLKEKLVISTDEDAGGLSKRLSEKGREVLLSAIDLVRKGRANFVQQDDSMATYAPKLKKEDGIINWDWSRDKIYNRIRAFVPWPGCWTYWDKKLLKIWKANSSSGHLSIPYKDKCSGYGTVVGVSKDGILVNTGDGLLKIEELQLEGKLRMNAKEFLIGHKQMKQGVILGNKN